jgi:hypothetical protein
MRGHNSNFQFGARSASHVSEPIAKRSRFGAARFFCRILLLGENRDVPHARTPGAAQLGTLAKSWIVRKIRLMRAASVANKNAGPKARRVRGPTNAETFQRERPIRQRREEERAAAWTSAETCMDHVCCPGTGPRTSKMIVPSVGVASGLATSTRSGPVVGLLERDGHCIAVSAGAADT